MKVPHDVKSVLQAYADGDISGMRQYVVELECDALFGFLLWQHAARREPEGHLPVALVLGFYEEFGLEAQAASAMGLGELAASPDWWAALDEAVQGNQLKSVVLLTLARQIHAIQQWFVWLGERQLDPEDDIRSLILAFYESKNLLAYAEEALYVHVDKRRGALRAVDRVRPCAGGHESSSVDRSERSLDACPWGDGSGREVIGRPQADGGGPSAFLTRRRLEMRLILNRITVWIVVGIARALRPVFPELSDRLYAPAEKAYLVGWGPVLKHLRRERARARGKR